MAFLRRRASLILRFLRSCESSKCLGGWVFQGRAGKKGRTGGEEACSQMEKKYDTSPPSCGAPKCESLLIMSRHVQSRHSVASPANPTHVPSTPTPPTIFLPLDLPTPNNSYRRCLSSMRCPDLFTSRLNRRKSISIGSPSPATTFDVEEIQSVVVSCLKPVL